MHDTKREHDLDNDLAKMDEWQLTSVARLEKHILNFYKAKGYVVGKDNWGFHIQLNSEWKSKHIAVYFYANGSPTKVTDDEEFETLKEAFSEVYKQFKINTK